MFTSTPSDIQLILSEVSATSPVSLNTSNLFDPYSAITPPEAFSPDLYPSSTSMSPSMLNMPPLRTPREFHSLIIGIIKQREVKSISFGDDDAENAELNKLMDKFENSTTDASDGDDWASNEDENTALNKVMDEYEGMEQL